MIQIYFNSTHLLYSIFLECMICMTKAPIECLWKLLNKYIGVLEWKVNVDEIFPHPIWWIHYLKRQFPHTLITKSFYWATLYAWNLENIWTMIITKIMNAWLVYFHDMYSIELDLASNEAWSERLFPWVVV